MKKIILISGLALLVLLGIVLMIDFLLRLRKNSRKSPAQSDKRDDRQNFHQGTVIMEEGALPADFPPGADFRDVKEGYLRHYGVGDWPAEIPVALSIGGVFTIGRFDVSLGRKNSDFEFGAKSKAVSRRHAAISRDDEGFMMQDLHSKAGTIVNGVKLESEIYYRLMSGFTVSFGTAGADYIWEESL